MRSEGTGLVPVRGPGRTAWPHGVAARRYQTAGAAMEFQLLTVSIEDHLPRGLAEGVKVPDDLLCEDWLEEARGPSVKAEGAVGAVAFLFGRTAEGRSVCVRVAGVRPCLFFELEAGSCDVPALEVELNNEVRGATRGERVAVAPATFCHAYYLEYDPEAPSGRAVHAYAEARYPSVGAWRAACALRRRDQIPRLAREVEALSRRSLGHVAPEELASFPRPPQLARAEKRLQRLCEMHRRDNEGAAPPPDDGRRLCRVAQEAFVDPVTRFLQEAGLSPSKWYRVPVRSVEVRVTTCDEELEAGAADLVEVEGRDAEAPHVTLYYDIETTGLDAATYPVIQVSLVFVCEGVRDRHLVALDAVAPIEGVAVHECASEPQLLERFRELVLRRDPDFFVAYNGIKFDNPFLDARARLLGVEDFFYLSRFALRPCRLRESKVSSGGMGDNVLQFFDMPGRSNFDWFVKLKRDLTSEPTYALDHFARTLCGDHKEELASGLLWRRAPRRPEAGRPLERCDRLAAALAGGKLSFSQAEWEAFGVRDLDAGHHVALADGRYFRPVNVKHRAIAPLHAGSAEDRARLGSYCVQDSVLLDKLNVARTMITEILQFCGVFHVPPEWIYFRGQQVRYVAQVLRKARTAEAVPMLLNRPHDGWCGEGESGFEGATVNEPERGFHKDPGGVVVLDWKSLYPALMMSHNLCPSTVVRDPRAPGAPTEGVVEHRISDTMVAHFATHQRGILPRILEELSAERNASKRRMKTHLKAAKEAATDEERRRHKALANVYDGRQLALKVSSNSVYGCNGTDIGSWPNLFVSAATTLQGRNAMVVKKQILPQRFPGIRIIYGDTDSVFVAFPQAATLEESAALAVQACEHVNHHFMHTLGLKWMELEYEKTYKPYLIEGKKRYMGRKYEPGADGAMELKGMDAKGVETERKDTLPFTKDVMVSVRDALLVDLDEHKAFAAFCAHMDELVADRVPMERLILKKNLSSKVESKTDVIAHAKVNALRREREAGSEAATNEQVEYVMVVGHKSAKATELAEDPEYVAEQGLKLNRKWYFEHCVVEALGKIFSMTAVDFAGACRRYSALLDGERLNVNSTALRGMVAAGGEPGPSSASEAGPPRRPPPPPRPPPPAPKRKKK